MLQSTASSSVRGRDGSIQTPEEDDETMSGSPRDAPPRRDHSPRFTRQRRGQADSSYCRLHGPHPEFTNPTPFPSQAPGSAWLPPSVSSGWSGYPSTLPSGVAPPEDFLSLPGGGGGSSWSSLEKPTSLRSNPPSEEPRHHTLSPYACAPMGAPCCAQCPAEAFTRAPGAELPPWAQPRPGYSSHCPTDCRPPRLGFSPIGQSAPVKAKPPPSSTSLSLEQRRVFVTYEADDERHVNEIINFVALLRHNGFDTHIDLFEQQFRSISTIDFMEHYLSEKEYLIIIIISAKYYETVTSSPVSRERDERTFNTVYIHKQLQNEFIQNGSKNFRFIPILFPGAKKSHVPNWLQNTNIYRWPRDQDDILRRLMRVEKYNPPPIGDLPTIVSIPI